MTTVYRSERGESDFGCLGMLVFVLVFLWVSNGRYQEHCEMYPDALICTPIFGEP